MTVVKRWHSTKETTRKGRWCKRRQKTNAEARNQKHNKNKWVNNNNSGEQYGWFHQWQQSQWLQWKCEGPLMMAVIIVVRAAAAVVSSNEPVPCCCLSEQQQTKICRTGLHEDGCFVCLSVSFFVFCLVDDWIVDRNNRYLSTHPLPSSWWLEFKIGSVTMILRINPRGPSVPLVCIPGWPDGHLGNWYEFILFQITGPAHFFCHAGTHNLNSSSWHVCWEHLQLIFSWKHSMEILQQNQPYRTIYSKWKALCWWAHMQCKKADFSSNWWSLIQMLING